MVLALVERSGRTTARSGTREGFGDERPAVAPSVSPRSAAYPRDATPGWIETARSPSRAPSVCKRSVVGSRSHCRFLESSEKKSNTSGHEELCD